MVAVMPVLLARLDDPLADDAVAGDILLDGVGSIRVAIALDEVERGLAAVDAGPGEHSRARGVDAWPGHHAGVHHVGIREDVGR